MASQPTHPQQDTAETDFHQWALNTASALKKRQLAGVDWDRVSEELYTLARAEERELLSRLAQLMYHLLKQTYQPERITRSWQLSVTNQRSQIQTLLQEQPSLKTKVADAQFWEKAYLAALALSDTESLPDSVVNRFPEACPFNRDILSLDLPR